MTDEAALDRLEEDIRALKDSLTTDLDAIDATSNTHLPKGAERNTTTNENSIDYEPPHSDA